jgi:VWFA-related protein
MRALALFLLPALALAQQPPVFEAKVDVVAVDVNVLDATGKAVRGLKPEDFKITVDGVPRTVLSAEFVDFETEETAPEAPPPSPYFSTNEGVRPGRLILIAVDQGHISIGNGRAVLQAADHLLDQLKPTDRTGLVAFPGGVRVEFTGEHRLVREALAKVVGRARRLSQRVSISEAIAHVENLDGALWASVVDRECPAAATTRVAARDFDQCVSTLETEAGQVSQDYRSKARTSLDMLGATFDGLKTLDGPKTLILITEGMGQDDLFHVRQVAALAASARVSLFVLQIDSALFADASQNRSTSTPLEDDALLASPLYELTTATRGTIFRVTGTGGGPVFERVARELGAYYLLGFDPEAKDRDGKDHKLRVEVPGRKTTIRTRAKVNIPAAGVVRKDEEILASLMRAPFVATELPVRVATFSVRDRESTKVRVLVSAEVSEVRGGGLVTGFVLVDAKGKVAATGGQRLVEASATDPVTWLGTASVDPGVYTLKLSAVDKSGRRGSVEREFKAAITGAAGLELSDLLLGPVPGKEAPLRPGVDPRAAGGGLLAHLELYGSDRGRLKSATVSLEVAENSDGAAVLTIPTTATEAQEGDRRVAQGAIALDVLPPGDYVARAAITIDGKRVSSSLVRPFHVLPSTRGGEAMSLAGLSSSIPRFDRADMLRPDVLGHFLDRMGVLLPGPTTPPVAEAVARARRGQADHVLEALGNAPPDDVRVAFLRGIGHLARGETAAGSAQLRNAIRLSSAFMPAAVYLGACYATAGEDLQAAGAWQTALVSETTSAVLYALLTDALLRANQPGPAVEIAKEARRSWPEDVGLKRRLGIAEAMAGHRAEALALLVPYVEAHPEDPGAAFVTLRLLFQSFTAGGKPEERDRIVRFAKAYVDARGPNQEIVAHWLRYLEKNR